MSKASDNRHTRSIVTTTDPKTMRRDAVLHFMAEGIPDAAEWPVRSTTNKAMRVVRRVSEELGRPGHGGLRARVCRDGKGKSAIAASTIFSRSNSRGSPQL